ncbi:MULTISPECIES: MerR family transcriptional regulator [Streptomyces]|uniref:MerR family transcriptional regulator n=1 Tax=Streptomyces TaxID=1883 RepID=UPI003204633F
MRIGDLARETGVSRRLLRYYEAWRRLPLRTRGSRCPTVLAGADPAPLSTAMPVPGGPRWPRSASSRRVPRERNRGSGRRRRTTSTCCGTPVPRSCTRRRRSPLVTMHTSCRRPESVVDFKVDGIGGPRKC